ncbi:MAG TPA: hypothetical protein VIM58_00490 [Candidatus Methylacidiphilales bacterium]
MKARLLLALFLTLVAVGARAEAVDPDALVRKMAARDKELARHRAAYVCTVREERQWLDADGKTVKTRTEEKTLRGDASSDREAQKKEMESESGVKAGAEQASHEEPFSILKIVDHYRYALTGEETVDGVPCYKVRFAPKPGQPFRSREEKVANQMEGYLWIAKGDLSLVRNEGRLTRPVSVAWFFATLREVEFSFRAAPLPNGEMGPARIEYRFRVAVPFGEIHERHIRTMTRYRMK